MGRFIVQVWAAFIRLLYKRTILVLSLLFCLGITGALWNISHLSSSLIESQALQNAALYAQTLKESRTLYTSEVVNRVKPHDITVTHDYDSKNAAIPLPATFLIELGKYISEENPGMSVRLYSDYPFPWRRAEGGPRDNFERDALRYLKAHPNDTFSRIQKFRGRQSLRYAVADTLQPSCVGCHNTHPATPKNDWKVGDVRGILEITHPLDTFVAQTRVGLQGTFTMLAILSALALLGLTLVMGRLRRTSQELERRVMERTAELQKTNEELENEIAERKLAEEALQLEQEKSDRLLLNILPEPIAKKLKQDPSTIAELFAEVTILFADLVNFTQWSAETSPTELVELLNQIFSGFDRITEQHGLEKIKTIGDSYMVVGGLPTPRSDHAEAIANMAQDMQQELANFNAKHEQSFTIRIGINTGSVVAGVIGTKKFIYDLWGDAVNTASRMESHGIAGRIQVSESTYERLRDQYALEERGIIEVKGKGEMRTYFLIGRKFPDRLA
ncbi:MULTISPECIES: adenylate/guanylate cyclase domain-containing protein [unclassified Coleofasciculus]|uniref:adenylate/guanylate cyclase domain-containing protein n=1 Tax=unclassified Coleofasciculus TaxID=2692782 RepID=UPI00187FA521|nr:MULTISPECIES: adenylate/guanylate cyclase domain-containing protein [unclassified Coleofasciculus]MBE9130022.1 DUF3365 domain-containing protein [Coleofasciculus sp. LEGE 07081]MBE9147916.1 DUF3365 domain-containing protein [Coleofasciculus sp. LEGE 07092]